MQNGNIFALRVEVTPMTLSIPTAIIQCTMVIGDYVDEVGF